MDAAAAIVLVICTVAACVLGLLAIGRLLGGGR